MAIQKVTFYVITGLHIVYHVGMLVWLFIYPGLDIKIYTSDIVSRLVYSLASFYAGLLFMDVMKIVFVDNTCGFLTF